MRTLPTFDQQILLIFPDKLDVLAIPAAVKDTSFINCPLHVRREGTPRFTKIDVKNNRLSCTAVAHEQSRDKAPIGRLRFSYLFLATYGAA